MKKRIPSRRQQFNINIRREERQKIIREKRNQLLNIDIVITPQDFIKSLKLIEREQPYTLINLLQIFQQDLLNPVVYFKTQKGAIHIQYLKQLSQGLYNQTIKPQEQLIQFISRFLQVNKHREINRNAYFQLHFLNILQSITYEQNVDWQFKKKVLLWLQTVDTLQIIGNCLPQKQFLSINYYKNVYKILQLGLKSGKDNIVRESARILRTIMNHADWDDAYSVYEKRSGIMQSLIAKLDQFIKLKMETKDLVDCICQLLSTYDQSVIDYAKMGVGLLTAYLVTSNIQQYEFNGLRLLKILCEVQDHQFISYLFEDREIEGSGMWDKFSKTQQFIYSRNLDIKKLFHTIVHSIFTNGKYQQIIKLTNLFDLREDKDYLDLIDQILRGYQEEEIDIIIYMLDNINTLLFYGSVHSFEGQNMIILKLQDKQTIKIIETLTKHTNRRISQQAEKLIQSINMYTKGRLFNKL